MNRDKKLLEMLKEMSNEYEFFKDVTVDEFIFHSVFSLEDFKKQKRTGEISFDRHILCALLYLNSNSLMMSGRAINRSHCTIINSIKFVYNVSKYNPRELQRRITKHNRSVNKLGRIPFMPKIAMSGYALDQQINRQMALNKQ